MLLEKIAVVPKDSLCFPAAASDFPHTSRARAAAPEGVPELPSQMLGTARMGSSLEEPVASHQQDVMLKMGLKSFRTSTSAMKLCWTGFFEQNFHSWLL